MNDKRLTRVYLAIEPDDAITYSGAEPFAEAGGQVQIHAAETNHAWTLHLIGDPEHWRHLAAVIVSAADHVENEAHAKRDRYVSPLGDRRERPVPCSMCRRPTAALDALCEQCFDKAQGYESDGAA